MITTHTLVVDFNELALADQAGAIDAAIADAPIPTGSLVGVQVLPAIARWESAGSDEQGSFEIERSQSGVLIILTYEKP